MGVLFDVRCPSCGEVYHAILAHVGRSLQCRRCQFIIHIDAPSAPEVPRTRPASAPEVIKPARVEVIRPTGERASQASALRIPTSVANGLAAVAVVMFAIVAGVGISQSWG